MSTFRVAPNGFVLGAVPLTEGDLISMLNEAGVHELGGFSATVESSRLTPARPSALWAKLMAAHEANPDIFGLPVRSIEQGAKASR